MAELLICVDPPAPSGNPYADAQIHQRGDVIAVKPDGYGWGSEERSMPGWAVVPVPGIPPDAFAGLIDPDPLLVGDPPAMNTRWRLRRFRVDLAALAAVRTDAAAWAALVAIGTREAAYAAGLIVVAPELP